MKQCWATTVRLQSCFIRSIPYFYSGVKQEMGKTFISKVQPRPVLHLFLFVCAIVVDHLCNTQTNRACNLFEWAIGFAHSIHSLVCNLKMSITLIPAKWSLVKVWCRELICTSSVLVIATAMTITLHSQGWKSSWGSGSNHIWKSTGSWLAQMTNTQTLWVVPEVSNDLSASAACAQMLGTKASRGEK